MFDDGDPVVATLREICPALPGGEVKLSHGRQSFFTTSVEEPGVEVLVDEVRNPGLGCPVRSLRP